jgi:hypothetical protein
MLQILPFPKLKRTIIWMLFGLLGYANVSAQSQDTLYITSTSAFVQLQWRTNVKNILVTNVNCDTLVAYGQGTQIIIKDVQTEVQRFLISSFIFKINGSVVSGSSAIYTAINNLNPGVIPKLQLLKTIKVVSALPSPLEANTQYVVGDTNFINITGLLGNDAKLWQVVINGVAIGTSTADIRLVMLFNNITTAGAYTSTNSQITQAGALSAQNVNTSFFTGIVSTINTLAPVVFSSNINISPCVVASSVFRQVNASGAYARSASIYGHTSSGGFWRDATSQITSIQITTSSPSTTRFTTGTEIQLLQLNK